MKTIYITLDNDGYVNGYGSNPSDNPNEIAIQLFYNHEFFKGDKNVFKYVDGELIKDDERQRQILEEQEKEENKPTPDEINEMALLELAMLISDMKGGN